jgi:hypothetical protein
MAVSKALRTSGRLKAMTRTPADPVHIHAAEPVVGQRRHGSG